MKWQALNDAVDFYRLKIRGKCSSIAEKNQPHISRPSKHTDKKTAMNKSSRLLQERICEELIATVSINGTKESFAQSSFSTILL